MAITRVQKKNGSTDGSASIAVTFDANVTAGAFLVALLSNYYGTTSGFGTGSIADSLGNTWATAVLLDDATSDAATALPILVSYAQSPSGGADTVTFSGITGGVGFTIMTIIEYSGIATSSPVDSVNKARYGYDSHGFVATSSYQSGSITTVTANALILGCVATRQVSDIYTPDSGWSEIDNKGNSFNSHAITEQIVSATASFNNSGALSASQNFVSSAVVAFKGAGGGGGGGAVSHDLPLMGVGKGLLPFWPAWWRYQRMQEKRIRQAERDCLRRHAA